MSHEVVLSDESSAALLYVEPLERLFALTSQLDRLFADDLDRAERRRIQAQILQILRVEKCLLRAVDAAAKTFLQCRGGQRE